MKKIINGRYFVDDFFVGDDDGRGEMGYRWKSLKCYGRRGLDLEI